ncbi:hypothetical protein [Paracoccus yeei]|uniref:hypothetical protein n=1 Tax=Paracoccus yeei TaxID=147645 RepID=UPI003BF8EDCE
MNEPSSRFAFAGHVSGDAVARGAAAAGPKGMAVRGYREVGGATTSRLSSTRPISNMPD